MYLILYCISCSIFCHFAVVVAAVVFFVLRLSPRLCTDDGTLKSKNFLLHSVPFEQKVLHFQGLRSLKFFENTLEVQSESSARGDGWGGN